MSFESTPIASLNEAPSLKDAALAYGTCGIPVFPLAVRGKRPLVRHGLYEATTNRRQIEVWWAHWPQANIGVPCGEPSGWWVMDIDPRNGGLEGLKQLARHIPTLPTLCMGTRQQRTGGAGVHVLFCAGQFPIHRCNGRMAGIQGIDWKTTGGYIVVAPSIHASGHAYLWRNELALAPLPAALQQYRPALELIQGAMPSSVLSFRGDRGLAQPRSPAFYLRIALDRATVGRRHTYALYLACRLILDVGLDRAQATPWMREYARRVPQLGHPYTEAEALGCLPWAITQVHAA